jgi:photosystem II stability/assembly factor-like uncharacterized protein
MGGDGMECIIDYSNVNIQYGTIYFGVIERTMNHWVSSTHIHPRDDGAWVTPYIIHPTNPATLFAGYSELYKTTNRGNTWTQISEVNATNKLKNIAICASDPNVIFMADDSRMWRTIDGGDIWERLTLPSSGTITSICIKNDDPNTIWFTRGGYNANRVFKTTNGGTTWTNISNGLPAIPLYSLVYNKLEGQSEQLYVGTEVGVYFKDGENNWVYFNNGLPNVKIGEIELYYDVQNPENCRLRAATYGRGLWESPIYIPTAPVAGTVIGNALICDNEVAQLFLIGFAGAIQWQESSNGNAWNDITGAQNAFYQTVPLTSSKYFRAKVTLGTVAYSNEFLVEVASVSTPVIIRIENSLISNIEEGNQLYNQDGLIPGAIAQTFNPTENGTYFTIVTIGICSTLPSNSIVIDNLSIGGNAKKDGGFLLYPNPVTDLLTILNEKLKIYSVILIDVLGREVINIQENNVYVTTINLTKLPAGLFQVRIETDQGIYTSKVVKQ